MKPEDGNDHVLSYDEFLAAFHKGEVVLASSHGTSSATTNPVGSTSIRPLALMRDRLDRHGLWDRLNHRPLFGWAPAMFGWLIVVRESSNTDPSDCEVTLNGHRWRRTDGLVPWGESRWSSEA